MTALGPVRPVGDRLGRSALRASVATSPLGGVLIVVVGTGVCWALTYVLGGAEGVVPHFYYLPIVFAAVRFGPAAAVLVALASGVLAGPLTYLDVSAGTSQELSRWLTRTGFFVVVGLVMASLVRPSLPSVADELRRSRAERRLRQAIERRELFVRYQPIVDLGSGRLYGVETLVRWQHPEHGELQPADFLATAEASEVIHELGGYVLDEACRQAALWQRPNADEAPLVVTVNLCARELDDPGLVARVAATLERTGLEPSRLCLEITESVLVSEIDVSVSRLHELKALGVRLAVDDFGTGYSSMAVVHRYPIDVLKVDRSFVAPIGIDDVTTQVLWGLLVLARSLALTTVAEGVETDEQDAALADLGYQFGQGFRYAEPLLAAEVTELLTNSGSLRPTGPDGPGPGAGAPRSAAGIADPPSPERADGAPTDASPATGSQPT